MKILNRWITLLLIPCLIADPALSAVPYHPLSPMRERVGLRGAVDSLFAQEAFAERATQFIKGLTPKLFPKRMVIQGVVLGLGRSLLPFRIRIPSPSPVPLVDGNVTFVMEGGHLNTVSIGGSAGSLRTSLEALILEALDALKASWGDLFPERWPRWRDKTLDFVIQYFPGRSA